MDVLVPHEAMSTETPSTNNRDSRLKLFLSGAAD